MTDAQKQEKFNLREKKKETTELYYGVAKILNAFVRFRIFRLHQNEHNDHNQNNEYNSTSYSNSNNSPEWKTARTGTVLHSQSGKGVTQSLSTESPRTRASTTIANIIKIRIDMRYNDRANSIHLGLSHNSTTEQKDKVSNTRRTTLKESWNSNVKVRTC